MVEEIFEPGFFVVGVPVGTDNYVTGTLRRKLDSLEAEVTRAINLLGGEPHVLWTILRSSVIHKLEYWLGSVHPSLMAASAARMDALFLRVPEASAGSDIPQSGPEQAPAGLREQWPVTVLDVPAEGLQEKSFQWWVAQLPVKHGGLGLRSQSYLSKVSYLGSVELCLPSFAGPQGICANLAHLAGEEESKETRWAPLLASGSRLGEEFIAAWTRVKTEAEQLSAFVEEE